MAEVVGLAASVLQIGGAGAKLSIELYNFISTASRADADITHIAVDVEVTSKVLGNVGKVLEGDDAKKLVNQDAVQHAKDLIGQCEEVFNELSNVVQRARKTGKDGKPRTGFRAKISWPMKEQRVELLRRRLETLKSSLLVLFHVLQLAHDKARGDVEVAYLEDQKKNIRELHQQQQDSLKILKALEQKLCPDNTDNDVPLQASSMSASIMSATSSQTAVTVLATPPPSSTANEQIHRNNLAMSLFKDLGPDTSDSDAVMSSDEGEHLTLDELAECAAQVQKLLRRIMALQDSLKSGQAQGHHRKRRMHKVYRRFCRKFETNIVESTPVPLAKASGSEDEQISTRRFRRIDNTRHTIPRRESRRIVPRGVSQASDCSTSSRPTYQYGPPPSWSAVPWPQPPQYLSQGLSPEPSYEAQQVRSGRQEPRPHLQARVQTSDRGYLVPPQAVQVQRSDRNMPSAKYYSNAPPSRANQRPSRRVDYGDQEEEYSASESDSESERHEGSEYQPRPRIRQAHTSTASPPPEVMRPLTSILHQGQERSEPPRLARRTSMSRPALVSPIKSQSYDAPRARVLVEGSRSSRRDSSHAYVRDKASRDSRRTRRHEYAEPPRAVKPENVYENIPKRDRSRDYVQNTPDSDEGFETRRVLRRRRRRDTDTETRPQSRRLVESLRPTVEDYFSSRSSGGESFTSQQEDKANTDDSGQILERSLARAAKEAEFEDPIEVEGHSRTLNAIFVQQQSDHFLTSDGRPPSPLLRVSRDRLTPEQTLLRNDLSVVADDTPLNVHDLENDDLNSFPNTDSYLSVDKSTQRGEVDKATFQREYLEAAELTPTWHVTWLPEGHQHQMSDTASGAQATEAISVETGKPRRTAAPIFEGLDASEEAYRRENKVIDEITVDTTSDPVTTHRTHSRGQFEDLIMADAQIEEHGPPDLTTQTKRSNGDNPTLQHHKSTVEGGSSRGEEVSSGSVIGPVTVRPGSRSRSRYRRPDDNGSVNNRRHDDGHRNQDDSRSRSRNRGGRKSDKWEQASKAALVAGAVEAFRRREVPGAWTGAKGQRFATAALGAAGVDGLVDCDSEKIKKRHVSESALGGLLADRAVDTLRPRSRSRPRVSRGDSLARSRTRSRSISGRSRLRSRSRSRSRDGRANTIDENAREMSDHNEKLQASNGASSKAATPPKGETSNGEIRLIVDASSPVSLSFNGDMEGRTLQIHPAEDGMNDIVIHRCNSRSPSERSRYERISREDGQSGNLRALVTASQTRRDTEMPGERRRGRARLATRKGDIKRRRRRGADSEPMDIVDVLLERWTKPAGGVDGLVSQSDPKRSNYYY